MITLSKKDWDILISFNDSFIDREVVFKSLGKRANLEEMKHLILETQKFPDKETRFRDIFSKFPHTLDIKEYTNFCRFCLLLPWHNEHENIVGVFQLNWIEKSTDNIFALECFIENIPSYINADNYRYSVIRKIVYSIAAQPKPFCKESLKKMLAKENDENIIELIVHQLKKIQKDV